MVVKDGGFPCWPDDLGHDEAVRYGSEARTRLEMAEVMRNDGNSAYESGDEERAIKKYTQAIRWGTFH